MRVTITAKIDGGGIETSAGANLYASEYARCLNPECDDFGDVRDVECPDSCCDGPFAIYVLHHVETIDGKVLAAVEPSR